MAKLNQQHLNNLSLLLDEVMEYCDSLDWKQATDEQRKAYVEKLVAMTNKATHIVNSLLMPERPNS